MRCPDCGHESPQEYNFCPRCGYALDPSAHRATPWILPPSRAKSESKTAVIIIAVVIMVVTLPIAAAAVLYYMVLGGESTPPETPVTQLFKTSIANGASFQFTSATSEVEWRDVSFSLAGLGYAYRWAPDQNDLVSPSGLTTFNSVPMELGQITFWSNLTDITGNGMINQGDYLTIETGAPYSWPTDATFEITVIYLPTDGTMVTRAFIF